MHIVARVDGNTYTLPIGDAAHLLGVSIDTVRRWERRELLTAVRTPTGQRRFSREEITEIIARYGLSPADREVDAS